MVFFIDEHAKSYGRSRNGVIKVERIPDTPVVVYEAPKKAKGYVIRYVGSISGKTHLIGQGTYFNNAISSFETRADAQEYIDNRFFTAVPGSISIISIADLR